MKVAPLNPADRPQWEALWLESVDGALPKAAVDHTFEAICAGRIGAFVAHTDEGAMAGLLHYVVHPVAGCVNPVCYMQDLYVTPASRRQGTASALIAALNAHAEERDYDRIYWLLDNGNESARAFYADIAVPLDFGLHMIPVRMRERLGLDKAARR